jgi:hypothetical protein
MKGISHFISGVTAASFFPWSVLAAQEGNPLYFVLGGAFGLLPDTLDFKFYRFFYRHDIYVEPDPHHPDPQAMAEALAGAVGLAHREQRQTRVKLNTIKKGADYWQQYIVKFDADAQEVLVKMGPVVNTGQVPVPGSEPENAPVGRAALPCRLIQTYEAVTTVDIFDGPSYAFDPTGKDEVTLQFLPWHRTWSHSLVTGLAFGAVATLAWGWKAGLVVPAAFTVHVLEDQLGHMGSNLFWPISRKRFSGMKKMHATDALPNFATVWTCILLLFWNLYRNMPDPVWRFGFLHLVLYGAVIPLGAFALVHYALTRGKPREEVEIDISSEENDAMMA